MAVVLALENLFDKVVARFASEGTLIDNHFGWKEPPRQGGNPNRIIWTPGDGSNSLGDLGGPRYPGSLPARPLAMLNESFTVVIVGADPQAKDDDRSQYHQTRLNYDAWVRAVYLAAHGTYSIKSQSWDITRKEGRFGAAIKVVGSIQAVIPDEPFAFAPITTSVEATGVIGTSEDPPVEITPDT
jgi:hypothetical protein